MSKVPLAVTPPEAAVEDANGSPSGRSISGASNSSLARWRMTQHSRDDHQRSASELSSTFNASATNDERPMKQAPMILYANPHEEAERIKTEEEEEREEEEDNAANANCDEEFGGSVAHSTSIEERSYRNMVSDRVLRSTSEPAMAASGHSTTHADSPQHPQQQQQQQSSDRHRPQRRDQNKVAGDEPVRWSFVSGVSSSYSPVTPDVPQQQHRNNEYEQQQQQSVQHSRSGETSPTAIAAAVPVIAQERASAADAYAGRWTRELQHSTQQEEELVRAYRQLEGELRDAQKSMSAAEVRQQKEVRQLREQLEKEREGRRKAEQDREDLLNQATISPGMSPRGGNVDASISTNTATAMAAAAKASTASSHLSDAFYEKMREREERARARVRKEFVRQAQENVYAEQKKTAEAEKAATLATRRLQKAEEELAKAQDALQEATAVMEAKDVQLHERAIHIQELEAQLRLLQRQLESAAEVNRQAEQLAQRRLEELQELADARLAELEAQRGFAYQLQEKLGLKTRDLFTQESNQESVLQQVLALQSRCQTLERDLEAAVAEATALLDQKRQQAESEAQLLLERNDELKKRCMAAESELATLRGRREYDAREIAQLRERYEKDLSDQKVEVRSLQLQLERVLDAARQRSSQTASEKEIQRQQQAALVRKYAAEATAAREELDRARAVLQRENEKHLRTILELSQQLTTLKEANTRLEHRANTHEHESADATRLLTRARQELRQLQEERRQLSRSLVETREESRMRSFVESHDGLQRRVAELENVRRDLNEKLLHANMTIEDMQQQQHQQLQLSYYNYEGENASSRGGSVRGWAKENEGEPEQCANGKSGAHARKVEQFDVHDRGVSGPQSSRQPAHTASSSASPSSTKQGTKGDNAASAVVVGLPDLLKSMGQQLEPILYSSAPQLQQPQRPSIYQSRRESATTTAATAVVDFIRPSLRERRLQDSTEHQDDDLVRSAKERVELHSTSPTAPQSDMVNTPVKEVGKAQQARGGYPVKEDMPSPQDVPSRPRRSSQPSISSAASEDYRVRFSNASDAFPAPLSTCRVMPADEVRHRPQLSGGSHVHEVLASTGSTPTRRLVKAANSKNSHRAAAAVSIAGKQEEEDQRDELESEPCWDSTDGEAVKQPHLSKDEPVPSHRLQSHVPQSHSASPLNLERVQPSPQKANAPPARPRRSVASLDDPSTATPASVSVRQSLREGLPQNKEPKTAPAPVQAAMVDRHTKQVEAAEEKARAASVSVNHDESDDVEGDGILRYSRIPEEVLSPVPKLTSRDVSAVAQTSTQEDAAQHLFSNIRYGSVATSVPRSSRDAHAASYGRSRHRSAVQLPESGFVIDVHQSTPPPESRTART